jgi:uncharacterized membrane protein
MPVVAGVCDLARTVRAAALRASGAFARVVAVAPQLVYLQVSEDPTEDLTEGFEAKLVAARWALAPLLMDMSAIEMG